MDHVYREAVEGPFRKHLYEDALQDAMGYKKAFSGPNLVTLTSDQHRRRQNP